MPLYCLPVTWWAKVMNNNLESLKAPKSHKPGSEKAAWATSERTRQVSITSPLTAVCRYLKHSLFLQFHFHSETAASTTVRASAVPPPGLPGTAPQGHGGMQADRPQPRQTPSSPPVGRGDLAREGVLPAGSAGARREETRREVLHEEDGV